MPAGRHTSGPLWVDGSIALRIRDKKQRSWRMVKIRHPFAVFGSHPRADLVVARDGVEPMHVFLFLDERGLFGVDLRTERGTRFAGSEAEAAWLGSGDLIEFGDHVIEVIQLRVNGAVLSHALSNDDPLGVMIDPSNHSRRDLTLRLLDEPHSRWSIGSSLVFLGTGPACAVEVGGVGVGATNSALFRTESSNYLIQFPGETTRINHESAPPAACLHDGDVLTIGADSLLLQTVEVADTPTISGPYDNLVSRLELAVGPDNFADIDFAFGNHRQASAVNPVDYHALIGRLQAETAALVAVLLRRIESLDDEMAHLREQMAELLGRSASPVAGPPVEKLRWDLIPTDPAAAETGSQSSEWLVERMRSLEAERQSTWTNLLSRLGTGKPSA